MAREMNSLFMANQPSDRRAIFSLQDFPPISAPGNYGNTSTYVPEPPRMNTYQSTYNPYGAQSFTGRPLHSLMEPQHTVHGYGRLSWLSSKGGLITTPDNKSVSFQTKEFCDESLNDLVQVLRVGFSLKYVATLQEANHYVASNVSPISGEEADRIFQNAIEIDLEEANPTPPNSKDAYSLALENSAYQALLSTFERQGVHKVQLSSLHSQMSNYGDEKLYRYVGTSSMKRRQFVERRTHVFLLQNDDSITLQYPAIYQLVVLLSGYLLRRGGVASVQCLYNFYTGNEVPQNIKDFLGYDRQMFMSLLSNHSFAFSMFPNRAYVSARRNLPNFDYCAFVKQYFPAVLNSQQQAGFVQSQQAVQRSLSHSGRETYGMMGRGQHQNYNMQQRHQYQAPPNAGSSSGSRPMSYAESQLTSPRSENQWTPLSNLGTWSSQASNVQVRQASRANSINGMDETLVANEFGDLQSLRQNDSKVSTGMQAGDNSIDQPKCTCECTCGRGNAQKSAGAIGSTRGLPPINPSVNNFGIIGPIGSRPLSFSNANAEDQPTTSESYNLFGETDVLRGSLDSLRLGPF